MIKPYIIFTPPFKITSGGIRVMWGIYGWLLAKGQIVYANETIQGQDSIAIYPEVIHGNPLEATKIVRYILNKPGLMGKGTPGTSTFVPGPTQFDPSDELYYFSRLFGKAKDQNHYMFLPIINTYLFRDQGKKRTKIAYFVGKGVNTNIHPQNAILIDRNFAQDQQALADLLNECEMLYCYDFVTAMTEVSRLCGCRVIIIPSVYTRKQFESYEPGLNGISWGKDEEIKLNTQAFRNHYLKMKEEFDKKLDMFISNTQK